MHLLQLGLPQVWCHTASSGVHGSESMTRMNAILHLPGVHGSESMTHMNKSRRFLFHLYAIIGGSWKISQVLSDLVRIPLMMYPEEPMRSNTCYPPISPLCSGKHDHETYFST